MSLKINYKNTSLKKISKNIVLFVDEKFSLVHLKKYISKLEFSYVSDLLKTSDLKKNIIFFELSSKKKIVLVSIKKELTTSNLESN